MEKNELENFGVKTDQRYVNRSNAKYGYVWVPDAVVADFLNTQKQKPDRLSPFTGLVEHLKKLISDYEQMIGKWEYEWNKRQGAIIERTIMWIEKGYPLGAGMIANEKAKLYEWYKKGLID